MVAPRSIIHLSSLTDIIPCSSSARASKAAIALRRKSRADAEVRFEVLDLAASERGAGADRQMKTPNVFTTSARQTSVASGRKHSSRGTSYLRHFGSICFCPETAMGKVGARVGLFRTESSFTHGTLCPGEGSS